MNDRYLVAVTTPDYVRKAGRWFSTVALIRSAKVVVVLLDFTPATDPDGKIEGMLRSTFPWIDFRHLSMPWSHSFQMIQHGVFLDAIPEIGADDVVCLTDLDIEIQRDFTPEEWEGFESLPHGKLSATWNGGRGDNLKLEGERIGLTGEWMVPVMDMNAYDPESIPCFNCGVLVGRAAAFWGLQWHYESLCQDFYASTSHRSRCQWLINYCVHWNMEGWAELPPGIHVHYHFKGDDDTYVLPPGTEQRQYIVTEKGIPVVFLHLHPQPRRHPKPEGP